MGDAVKRRIRIMQYIPRRSDGSITVERLIELLEDDSIDATERAIQRDLKELSDFYPNLKHSENKPYHWFWNKDETLPIPAMGPSTALTFYLAEETLRPLLPADCRSHLNANFMAAKKVLDQQSRHSRSQKWLNKVRVVPPSFRLVRAPIKAGIYDTVTRALYDDRILEISYTSVKSEQLESGPETYQISPYALIHRDTYTQLVGKIRYDNKIRRWSLHRMHKARILPEPSIRPRSFNLDQYIKNELGFPLSGNEIKLKAWIHQDASQHVQYTKLSDDQEIEHVDNGLIVTATIRETVELKWWLLGLGKRIEVLEPASLRNEMKSTLQEAAKLYR